MKNKRAPENTARLAKEQPLAFFAEAILLGAEGAILNQEASGQRQFVASETLPADIKDSDKIVLEQCGTKFLGVVEGDSLFQYVELPSGWKKVPTGHSMWSELRDEKNRKRGGIFYKAAFYDRKAHLVLDCRFTYQSNYDLSYEKHVAQAIVLDGEAAIFKTGSIPEDAEKPWMANESTCAEARTWLDEYYPDWRNPGAYWD